VAQVNNSGNSGGNRTKLLEARIYSTAEVTAVTADTKKPDANSHADRLPLHPVQDGSNNIIDIASTHNKYDNKRKTDPPTSSSSAPSRPESASSSAPSSHTTTAPSSLLERNVTTASTTTSSSAGRSGGGNIYRPFSNVHRCFLSYTQLYYFY